MRKLTLLTAVFVLTCGAPKSPGKGTPPEHYCPGAAGCEKGNDGNFTVGFAAIKTTPLGWEQPRADFLVTKGLPNCVEGSPIGTDNQPHCGDLIDNWSKDCGHDAVCMGDPGYTAPDADGSQGDGKPDWFFDCGRDRLCPGAAGYTAPDSDGTEGNGKFDGYWFAGFDNNRPMYDVHDDSYARALVMTNGDVSIAIVSIDAVGLFNDEVVRIRSRVAKKMTTPPDFILISSTHTHEGPDTMGQWGPQSGAVPERGVDDVWLDKVLIENAAQAVADAAMSAKPAKVYSAVGHLGDRTRETIRDSRDPQIIDDTVNVLKFTEKASGIVIGTLVNWGNHPESAGGDNNRLSSDFAAVIRDDMEKGVFNGAGQMLTAGVGGTCVFLQGKVGGLMTPLHVPTTDVDGTSISKDSFEHAKAVGDLVAQVGLASLANAKEITAPNLAYGHQGVVFRVENDIFQLTFVGFTILTRKIIDFDKSKSISESNYPKLQSEISKIQLGPVRFLGVPGELFPELALGYDAKYAFGKPLIDPANPNPPDLTKVDQGPYLNEQLGGEMNMVVGLAGDELGYLVPSYDYKVDAAHPYDTEAPGDHYEETNSLGPSEVPTLLEAAKALTGWEPSL